MGLPRRLRVARGGRRGGDGRRRVPHSRDGPGAKAGGRGPRLVGREGGRLVTYWLTVAVFAVTYLGLALGRLPGVRLDRAGIALVGAILMLVAGVLPFEDAVSPQAVDYAT